MTTILLFEVGTHYFSHSQTAQENRTTTCATCAGTLLSYFVSPEWRTDTIGLGLAGRG